MMWTNYGEHRMYCNGEDDLITKLVNAVVEKAISMSHLQRLIYVTGKTKTMKTFNKPIILLLYNPINSLTLTENKTSISITVFVGKYVKQLK